MATWKIPTTAQRAAAQQFLTSGAPLPERLDLLGRWHAPGSASGFLPVEADDLGPVTAHMAESSNLLELSVTPVMEDQAAGAAIAQGIG